MASKKEKETRTPNLVAIVRSLAKGVSLEQVLRSQEDVKPEDVSQSLSEVVALDPLRSAIDAHPELGLSDLRAHFEQIAHAEPADKVQLLEKAISSAPEDVRRLAQSVLDYLLSPGGRMCVPGFFLLTVGIVVACVWAAYEYSPGYWTMTVPFAVVAIFGLALEASKEHLKKNWNPVQEVRNVVERSIGSIANEGLMEESADFLTTMVIIVAVGGLLWAALSKDWAAWTGLIIYIGYLLRSTYHVSQKICLLSRFWRGQFFEDAKLSIWRAAVHGGDELLASLSVWLLVMLLAKVTVLLLLAKYVEDTWPGFRASISGWL